MKLDHAPWRPWYYIVGEQVISKVTPQRLTATICAGRMEKRTIDMLIAVVEVSKIINKMTEKDLHDGVKS